MTRLLMAGALLALWDLWRFFRRGRAHWEYRKPSTDVRAEEHQHEQIIPKT